MSKYIRNFHSQDLDKKDKSLWVLGYMCLLSVMIVMGTQYRQLTIAGAILAGIGILFVPSEMGIEILFFLISFENVFKLGISSSSMFTYLQVLPICKIMFFDRSFAFTKWSLGIVMGFVLYTFLFCFTNITSELRIILGLLLIFAVFYSDVHRRIKIDELILFYSVGIILSCIWAQLNIPSLHQYVSGLVVRFDDGSAINRFSGLCANPNYFSIEVSLAAASHYILFRDGKESRKRFYFFMIVLLALGIMSQSKGFVLSMAFLVAAFAIRQIRHFNKYTLMLLGIILVVILLFNRNIISITEKYFSRVLAMGDEETTLNSATTGRWDIWMHYFDAILSDARILFFGNGIETNMYKSAHNIFIQSLYCLGLFGSMWYCIAIACMDTEKFSIRAGLVFICVLLSRAMSTNFLFYNNVYYYWILLFFMCKAPCEENECSSRRMIPYYGKWIRSGK